MGWGTAQAPDLSDALEAERARTARLERQLREIGQHLDEIDAWVAPVRTRLMQLASDGVAAASDLASELVVVLELVKRARDLAGTS